MSFPSQNDLGSLPVGAGILPPTSAAVPLNPELAALLKHRLKLSERKLELVKKNGLAYYRPWIKQDGFHRAGKFKLRMFRAGNRVGKSTMGCAEDCSWLRGERPWYSTSDPARYAGIPRHPVKGLIITTDWDKVDEIWTSERSDMPGKLWRFIPKDAVISKKRNHSGAIDTVEIKSALYPGNSLLKFDTVKSFKSNPMGAESSDWDFIHVDEPCPEAMYKAHARGLIDRGGSSWFTLTPLSEFWINDLFFPQDTGGLARDNVWADMATIYENPYLSREAIAAYEMLLTEEERECRLKGIPLHLTGLIYKSFRWAKHVLSEVPKDWESFTKPPRHWPLYIHIDPHPQTPHAVQFCTVDPFGTRYYFYDIFKKCGIKELTKLVLEFTKGYRIVATHCDPLGFIEQPTPNAKRGTDYTCMAFEFDDNGLFVEKATKALEHGILRVNEELGKEGPGGVRFCPTATRTLWEIQRYCWEEGENKPIDKDDHMMENLYRSELSNPRWVDFAEAMAEIDDISITSPRWQDDEKVVLSGAM